jgi:ankyrin repeat protein
MKPLTFAALVGLVLIFGITVAGATSRGRTQEGPLSQAAGRGDLTTVRSLLASGLNANTPDGPRHSRALSTAARSSRLEVMDALLAAGADPNLRDAGGNLWVPLMHAIHKHQTPAVILLLERGARPDGPPELTFTPLMMAVASGQTQSVERLLERGADPRRVAPGGVTILTLAVSGGALTDIDEPLLGTCHTETVKLLRTRVPDLGLDRTWRGRLATLFARLNGCQEVLALLGPPR